VYPEVPLHHYTHIQFGKLELRPQCGEFTLDTRHLLTLRHHSLVSRDDHHGHLSPGRIQITTKMKADTSSISLFLGIAVN
jgi:hypothetical protein